MDILVLDNYDSFTYNLVHLIRQITGDKVEVRRNDEISLDEVEQFDKIVLSPGPGIPDEAGISKDLIRKYAPTKSILGVCLGHQAIAEVFGGKIYNLKKVLHGVQSPVYLNNRIDYLFENIPSRFNGGRYHSWMVAKEELPAELAITSEDDNGEIMSISHHKYDVKGVQFHPESILTEYGEHMMANWLHFKVKELTPLAHD